MATEYRAQAGETLDYICWKHYGTEQGTTEAVLAANHGLCHLPVQLPLGTLILLPDLAIVQATTDYVRIWD